MKHKIEIKHNIKQQRVLDFIKVCTSEERPALPYGLLSGDADIYYAFGRHILTFAGIIGGMWGGSPANEVRGGPRALIKIALSEYKGGKNHFRREELIEWIICEYGTPSKEVPQNNLLAIEKLEEAGLLDKETKLIVDKYGVGE